MPAREEGTWEPQAEPRWVASKTRATQEATRLVAVQQHSPHLDELLAVPGSFEGEEAAAYQEIPVIVRPPMSQSRGTVSPRLGVGN